MSDLIRVHFCADLQQQMGVCFLQFCPGLRNAIDLGKESTFLERLGAAKGFHLRLFLLQRLVPAHQGRPVLVKQIIHTFLLLGSQMKCLGEVLVVPPAARGAKLQPSAHGVAAGAWLRRRVGRETLARIAGNSYTPGSASRDIRACGHTAPARDTASRRRASPARSLGQRGQGRTGKQTPRQQQTGDGRSTYSH
jgi:hypothetical protein